MENWKKEGGKGWIGNESDDKIIITYIFCVSCNNRRGVWMSSACFLFAGRGEEKVWYVCNS